MWQLTFYAPAAAAMGSAGVVSGLVELARHASKEKVRWHLPRRAGLSLGYGCGAAPHPRVPSQRPWLPCLAAACSQSFGMRLPHGALFMGSFEGGVTLSGWWGAGAQVVRVAVLALRNLLAAPGLDLGPDMVEAGLPKVVTQRQLQARSPRHHRCCCCIDLLPASARLHNPRPACCGGGASMLRLKLRTTLPVEDLLARRQTP